MGIPADITVWLMVDAGLEIPRVYNILKGESDMENNTNWENAYNEKQIQYKKLKKKYKKNKFKLKTLKAKRKTSLGSEKRAITRKIAKCKKKNDRRKREVKELKKKLHKMELELQKQQWDNECLKKQSKSERRIVRLETQIDFLNIFLKEAVPGLIKKYGKKFKNSGNSSLVIDAPQYTISDIED